MKTNKYISAIGLSLLLFCACDSDLETVIYNEDTAQPALLEPLPASCDLQAEETFRLAWTAPDLGYQAEVTNHIEMDLAGHDFSERVILSSAKGGTEFTSTAAAMNNRILSFLEAAEMEVAPVQMEFRIVSSISEDAAPLYSNVVSTTIVPFTAAREYPKIWVIGDYCGWSHDATQFLYSFRNDEVYQGVVDFDGKAANGFKITGVAGWEDAFNWGSNGSAWPEESASVQLVAGSSSGNIECYSARFYHFCFNTSSLLLTKNWSFGTLSIVGEAGNQVNGWGNAEVDLLFDKNAQCFWAEVELSDGVIKFRADHDWNFCFGYADEGLLSTDPGADNIPVQAGRYRITLNLNNADAMTYTMAAI